MGVDVYASSAIPWRMGSMTPRLFCGLRSGGHPHKPGWHRWTLCHSSILWTKMWCFPWSRSIEDRAFLQNPSLESRSHWLLAIFRGRNSLIVGMQHVLDHLNMRSRSMLQVWQKADVNESEEASILADLCWYSWPIDQGSSGCALNYMLILLLLI